MQVCVSKNSELFAPLSFGSQFESFQLMLKFGGSLQKVSFKVESVFHYFFLCLILNQKIQKNYLERSNLLDLGFFHKMKCHTLQIAFFTTR